LFDHEFENVPIAEILHAATYVISTHQRHGRTDGRTDRRTSYDGNTAPLL